MGKIKKQNYKKLNMTELVDNLIFEAEWLGMIGCNSKDYYQQQSRLWKVRKLVLDRHKKKGS